MALITWPRSVLLLVTCLVSGTNVAGFSSVHPLHRKRSPFWGSRNSKNGSARALKMEKLVFGGDYLGISEPLPDGTTKEAAVDFLLKNSTLDLLFGVGGTRPITFLETTPELRDMWEESCEFFECERKPTLDDLMLGVEAEVQFPGMKLITKSASGIFIMKNPKTGLDQYQAYFVGEEQRQEGLPPAVWLFKKLTGTSKREKGRFYPPSGQAVSVISLIENENGSLSFSFDVTLKITVNFPSTLLNILPMSKEKMEENAGLSIQKAISKDVDIAIKATHEAFLETASVRAG